MERRPMITVEGVLLGIVIGAVVWDVIRRTQWTAEGWEDETGIHYGPDPIARAQRRAIEDERVRRAALDAYRLGLEDGRAERDPDVINIHEHAESRGPIHLHRGVR